MSIVGVGVVRGDCGWRMSGSGYDPTGVKLNEATTANLFAKSMTELATVRTQIKVWERSFKEKHGRGPSVDEIKQQPEIAEKYKLYKKLSKSNAGPSQPQAIDASSSNLAPVTPPKRAALMPQRTRAVEPTVPLSSFNPFSPQKNKGKQRETPSSTRTASALVTRSRSPSPSPFQRTVNRTKVDERSQSPSHDPPAVLRARKRLRGEAVSPSPRKPKFARGHPGSQPSPGALNPHNDSMDDEGDAFAFNYIGKSPSKPSQAGRSFTLLFEEENEEGVDSLNVEQQPRLKSLYAGGLFGSGADEILGNNGKVPKQPQIKIFPPARNPRPAETTKHNSGSSRPIPLHTDPESDPVPGSPSIPPPSTDAAETDRPSSDDKPTKRTFQSKRKGKLGKESIITGQSHGDESEDDDLMKMTDNVKVITRSRFVRAANGGDELDLEMDPILAYSQRVLPRADVPPLSAISATGDDSKLTVDLPDELRQFLAFESAEPKSQKVDDDKVAQELIYGRRVGTYDPSRGGEIWDVGEDASTNLSQTQHPESEDDWEGEPIPWAAGEL
ncbi:hypothetical protein BDN72DRAFT_891041 [Pluteus cervinus]|uniref:Uncharacterized protein n=1 Tax=Pluteus cervinus TaxID=181527 RepID=A0ACD3BHH6_9AGAR|nr:hypothetical protein BDN72DRAFT_891041 [Pluteus cervinus]